MAHRGNTCDLRVKRLMRLLRLVVAGNFAQDTVEYVLVVLLSGFAALVGFRAVSAAINDDIFQVLINGSKLFALWLAWVCVP